jgi:PD-(D/E)XK nuclease superfamily protein
MDRKFFDTKFLPPMGRIERVDEHPEGRHYCTTKGHLYPSVTNVIGKALDKKYLADWQERVGKEKANKIRNQAAVRGSQVHALLERYVMNDPWWFEDAMPSALENFERLRPMIDANLTYVLGSEFYMYSHGLRTAGATDLICVWDKKLSIIDLKTTRRLRQPDSYEGYHIQTSAYGHMTREYLGTYPSADHNHMRPTHTVVLMLADDEPRPQMWMNTIEKHAPRVHQIFVKDRGFDTEE